MKPKDRKINGRCPYLFWGDEGAPLFTVRVDGVIRLLHEALPWLIIGLESKSALTTMRDPVQQKYQANPNR